MSTAALLAAACSGGGDEPSAAGPLEPAAVEFPCPDTAEIAAQFIQSLERSSSQGSCNFGKQADEDTDDDFTVEFDAARATDTDAAIAWMECLRQRRRRG